MAQRSPDLVTDRHPWSRRFHGSAESKRSMRVAKASFIPDLCGWQLRYPQPPSDNANAEVAPSFRKFKFVDSHHEVFVYEQTPVILSSKRYLSEALGGSLCDSCGACTCNAVTCIVRHSMCVLTICAIHKNMFCHLLDDSALRLNMCVQRCEILLFTSTTFIRSHMLFAILFSSMGNGTILRLRATEH